MEKRYFSNWVEGFLDYTKDFPTKPNYTKWAAISTIAAALQRRAWTRIIRRRQYANFYILLIGPPGSGKSVAIDAAYSIASRMHCIKLTPTRITKRAFYDELAKAQSLIAEFEDGTPVPKDLNIHHSITAMVSEFGVFVKRGDLEFMVDLADLYDCPPKFHYRTKTQGEDEAPNAWFNLLAACTEKYLRETLTNDAFEQGFPARVIMVYEDSQMSGLDLFGEDEDGAISDGFMDDNIPGDRNVFKHLIADLEQISLLHSNFAWSGEAKEFLDHWYANELRPYPLDFKLEHYNTRRLAHYSKLAIIGSAARGNSRIITLKDAEWAKFTLLGVERKMHRALKFMGDNKYIGIMYAIMKFVLRRTANSNKAVHEHEIRHMMKRDVPALYIRQIIDGLVADKSLIQIAGTEAPNRKFRPGPNAHKILEEKDE